MSGGTGESVCFFLFRLASSAAAVADFPRERKSNCWLETHRVGGWVAVSMPCWNGMDREDRRLRRRRSRGSRHITRD